MFQRFKNYLQSSKNPGGDIISLTEYFDDTVSKIVRTNRRKMFLMEEGASERLCEPRTVATLLLTGGQQLSCASRSAAQGEPVQPQNFEEGVLYLCDMSRQAYGIDTRTVMWKPGEIEKLAPSLML